MNLLLTFYLIALHALVVKEKTETKPAVPTVSAVGVYLPEGRKGTIKRKKIKKVMSNEG